MNKVDCVSCSVIFGLLVSQQLKWLNPPHVSRYLRRLFFPLHMAQYSTNSVIFGCRAFRLYFKMCPKNASHLAIELYANNLLIIVGCICFTVQCENCIQLPQNFR